MTAPTALARAVPQDTSENYANAAEIGAALREMAAEVPRSELFLADKISFPQSYSAAGVRKAVAASLAALGTTYLDLLMLHSVGPSAAARNEAWREMEKLRAEGVVRVIGTSNFGTAEMAQLRAESTVAPATAQVRAAASPRAPRRW
jgi:2,5-diketo-D-gluconate reductase A